MKKFTLWLFALFAFLQLNAQTGTVIVGVDDGTPNTTTGYPSPLQDYYKTGRAQYLYLASELSAAGLVAGPITEIGWVVTSIGTSTLEEGYKISMKSTTSTVLTTTFETGTSVVYGPTNFTPSATGNTMFTLSTPFVWDGTSNIIIDVCGGNASGDYTENVRCANSTLTFNGSAYFYSDTEASPCTIATIPIFNGDVSTSRPLLVAVGNLASCLAPLNLVSSGITSNSANVSWDPSVSGIATGYEYIVSTTNTVPTISGTPTNNTFAILSSLSPNTTYYLFVRTNCGGSFSGWAGPISFTTACVAVNTYPFIETFNTDSTSEACWSVINGNADANSWNMNGTTIPRSGQSAQLYTDFASSNNDYLVSPQFNLGTTPKRLKFWVRHYSNGEPDNLEVKISTGGKTIPDFTTTLLSLSTTQVTTTYTEYIVDLTPYTGLVYIAFARENAPADGWYIAVDDVTVENIPTCTEPSGLVSSSITAYTANVSWNAPSSAPALGYQYVLSTTNTVPTGSGTNVSNSYVALSSLSANTTYYFFIRSYCSSSDSSPWVGPISFTTACAPVTTFPVLEPFNTFLPSACWIKGDNGDLTTGPATFGTNSFYADGFGNVGTTGSFAYNIWMASANDWIISPEYTIPASGYELKFDAAAANYGATTAVTNWEADDFVEVLVSSTGTTNWTVLYTYNNSNVPAPTGTTNVIDLDAYAGQSVRFAYRVVEGTDNGAADLEFFIDNFQIRLTPTCPDLTGLTVSGVTATTANTSWNDMSGSGATGYEYAITTSPTPPTSGTATTSTFYAASSLLPQTVYYLHVRSSCGGGLFGNWASTSFTTTCLPITSIPWLENFDSLTTGTNIFPSCWGYTNVTSTWSISTSPTAYSGANSLRRTWGTDGWAFTPTFSLTAGTSYTFSYYVRTNDTTVGYNITVGVGTSQTSTGMTTTLSTVTGYQNPAWTLVTHQFTPTVSGDYSFGVHVVADFAPNGINFDNFELKLTPSTPPACTTGLTATINTSCGNFPTTLSWAAESTATGYYVTIGTTSGASNIANATPVVGTSYTFNGNYNTQYFWKVVPYNTIGSATGCVEQSFTTAINGCYCASVPTSNDGLGITNAIIGSNPYVIADVTYADNTATPNIINSGANANIQLTFSTGYSYDINIWIDFNNDYDFDDAGELVKTGIASTSTSPNTVDASFTMPLTAPSGLHRMRIGTADTGQVPPAPCYSGSYGVTLDFTVDTTLITSSFDTTNFVTYPNPVKDVLNLSYSSTITNVKVTNLLGQQVINKNMNDTNVQVNMADLAVGTYIVNVTSGDLIHTIKVVKQ